MIKLIFRKYWYVVVILGVICIGVFILLFRGDTSGLFKIIRKIQKKRIDTEKEIEVKRRLKEKKIKEIDEEYEKKKHEIEREVEKKFNNLKERGLLDDLALRFFGGMD